MYINFDDFKVVCRSLSGQKLYTLSQMKEFKFQMCEGHEVKFYFTPECTRRLRSVDQGSIECYIHHFNTHGNSLQPGDYPKHVNASYMVTLFKHYQDHLSGSGTLPIKKR